MNPHTTPPLTPHIAPHITLEQWRVLQAVIDQGGYAQAAKHLHKSQSAISYSVARIQEQLGLPLLQIEGRRAKLTAHGEALLSRSRQLLQQAQELESFAHSLEQGWESEIKLAVDTAFPTAALMQALKQFEPLSQGCRVTLSEVVLSGAEEALLQGEADLAICANVPANYLGEPLINFDFIAVSHPQHPLQQLRREVSTTDLEQSLQVVIQDSGIKHQRNVGWLGSTHQWRVSSIETAVAAVTEGLGYAWLPEHRIKHLLTQKQLKPIPLQQGGIYNASLYLAFGKMKGTGPGIELLANLLFAASKQYQ